jgi:hypothetical protein
VPSFFVKPAAPVLRPGHPAAAGLRFALPLHEGSGRPQDLSGNGRHGTMVGTAVAWGRGPFGRQLGGFSATSYVTHDAAAGLLGVTYPCWIVSIAANSGVADAFTVAQASTTSANQFMGLRYNLGGVAGQVSYSIRDNAGINPVVAATIAASTDGQPHVLMGWSNTASDHRLAWDGVQVASSTATLGAVTTNNLTLGVLRRTTVTLPFAGSLIGVAGGNGAIPDYRAVAADFFAMFRPGRAVILMAAAAVPSFRPAWAAGSNVFLTGAA